MLETDATPGTTPRVGWLYVLGIVVPALGLGLALWSSLVAQHRVEVDRRRLQRADAADELRASLRREFERRERDGPWLPAGFARVVPAGRVWLGAGGELLPFERMRPGAIDVDDVCLLELPLYLDALREEQRGDLAAASARLVGALRACKGTAERARLYLVLARVLFASDDARGALAALGRARGLPPSLTVVRERLRVRAEQRLGREPGASRAALERALRSPDLTYLERAALNGAAQTAAERRARSIFALLVRARESWRREASPVAVLRQDGVEWVVRHGERSITVARLDAYLEAAWAASPALRRSFVPCSIADADVVVDLPDLGTATGIRDLEPIAASVWSDKRARSLLLLGALALLGLALGLVATRRAVAKQAALAALRADFISSVSHELKTPLTAIQLNADLLRSGRLSEVGKRVQCCERIGTETAKLTQLVSNVLDAARIESGVRPRQAPVEIHALVDAVVRAFSARTDVEIRFASAGACWVGGDAASLERALANLLDNAVKYGAPPIEVACEREGDMLDVFVADHGPGIACEDRARLFERFERGVLHGPGRPAGSGLGLAIVATIAREHGGEILVEDRECCGVRLRLRLPVLEERRWPVS